MSDDRRATDIARLIYAELLHQSDNSFSPYVERDAPPERLDNITLDGHFDLLAIGRMLAADQIRLAPITSKSNQALLTHALSHAQAYDVDLRHGVTTRLTIGRPRATDDATKPSPEVAKSRRTEDK